MILQNDDASVRTATSFADSSASSTAASTNLNLSPNSSNSPSSPASPAAAIVGGLVQNISPAAEEKIVFTSAALLRSILIGSLSCVAALAAGLAAGISSGDLSLGIGAGFGTALLGFIIAFLALRRAPRHLTAADCFLPIPASVLSGVLFAPIQLADSSIFSTATCVGAGVLLSTALAMYRSGTIRRGYILIPLIVFIYEMLPIEFPTDIDNLLSLGGSLMSVFAAYLSSRKHRSSQTME